MSEILLPYPVSLTPGIFLRRYKRFFTDVERGNGDIEVVHCANSGSMRTCSPAGVQALTLLSSNVNRKLPHTLELLALEDGYACLNTHRANKLVQALFSRQLKAQPSQAKHAQPRLSFPGSDSFAKDFPDTISHWRSEAVFKEGTRFDFCLSSLEKKTWIEVKSVSLKLNAGLAFPDAVTLRGQKHMLHLADAVSEGHSAFCFFCIMRGSAEDPSSLAAAFHLAAEIDSAYSRAAFFALERGVRLRIIVAEISPEGVSVRGYFPFSARNK